METQDNGFLLSRDGHKMESKEHSEAVSLSFHSYLSWRGNQRRWCNVKEKSSWEGEFTLRSDPSLEKEAVKRSPKTISNFTDSWFSRNVWQQLF